jgi:hypothetical protein
MHFANGKNAKQELSRQIKMISGGFLRRSGFDLHRWFWLTGRQGLSSVAVTV